MLSPEFRMQPAPGGPSSISHAARLPHSVYIPTSCFCRSWHTLARDSRRIDNDGRLQMEWRPVPIKTSALKIPSERKDEAMRPVACVCPARRRQHHDKQTFEERCPNHLLRKGHIPLAVRAQIFLMATKFGGIVFIRLADYNILNGLPGSINYANFPFWSHY